MSSSAFTLSELICNVKSPVSIKEILDLYKESLTADNQFSVSVIFPILEIRMQDVMHNYLELKQDLRTTRERLEKLFKGFEDILACSSAILSIVEANFGIDGKVHEFAKEAMNEFKESCIELKTVIFKTVEYETKVLNLNSILDADIMNIIKDMIGQDLNETDYIKNQLKTMNERLVAYQNSISGMETRSKTGTVLQTFYALRKPVKSLMDLVIKKRVSGVYCSEDLINSVNQLNEKFEAILEGFNGLINSVYLNEDKQQYIIETITVYQLILNNLLDNIQSI